MLIFAFNVLAQASPHRLNCLPQTNTFTVPNLMFRFFGLFLLLGCFSAQNGVILTAIDLCETLVILMILIMCYACGFFPHVQ